MKSGAIDGEARKRAKQGRAMKRTRKSKDAKDQKASKKQDKPNPKAKPLEYLRLCDTLRRDEYDPGVPLEPTTAKSLTEGDLAKFAQVGLGKGRTTVWKGHEAQLEGQRRDPSQCSCATLLQDTQLGG